MRALGIGFVQVSGYVARRIALSRGACELRDHSYAVDV